MSNILDDPRVKHSSGTNDGSLDIELATGAWIAYPENGMWVGRNRTSRGTPLTVRFTQKVKAMISAPRAA